MLNKIQTIGLSKCLSLLKEDEHKLPVFQSVYYILNSMAKDASVLYMMQRTAVACRLWANSCGSETHIEIFSSELEAFLSLASEE